MSGIIKFVCFLLCVNLVTCAVRSFQASDKTFIEKADVEANQVGETIKGIHKMFCVMKFSSNPTATGACSVNGDCILTSAAFTMTDDSSSFTEPYSCYVKL